MTKKKFSSIGSQREIFLLFLSLFHLSLFRLYSMFEKMKNELSKKLFLETILEINENHFHSCRAGSFIQWHARHDYRKKWFFVQELKEFLSKSEKKKKLKVKRKLFRATWTHIFWRCRAWIICFALPRSPFKICQTFYHKFMLLYDYRLVFIETLLAEQFF